MVIRGMCPGWHVGLAEGDQLHTPLSQSIIVEEPLKYAHAKGEAIVRAGPHAGPQTNPQPTVAKLGPKAADPGAATSAPKGHRDVGAATNVVARGGVR